MLVVCSNSYSQDGKPMLDGSLFTPSVRTRDLASSEL